MYVPVTIAITVIAMVTGNITHTNQTFSQNSVGKESGKR